MVVTGASSGIGKATAIEFARVAFPQPIALILTARRLSKLEELQKEIETEYPSAKVFPVKLDVSESEEIHGFLGQLPERLRNIDILVNNAYPNSCSKANSSGLVKGVDKVGEIAEDDIKVMMDTNVTGLINVYITTIDALLMVQMTQAILPTMKSRNTGTIINISSIAGRAGYPGGAIYCATKAAVQIFTEALRHELISTKIRVINVDPGQVETEFSLIRFRGDEEAAKKVYQGVTPLTGEDVADVIVFAASRKENVVVADVCPCFDCADSV